MKPEWMIKQRDKDKYWIGSIVGCLSGLLILFINEKWLHFTFTTGTVSEIAGFSIMALFYAQWIWYYNLTKDIKHFDDKVRNFNMYCRKKQWIY